MNGRFLPRPIDNEYRGHSLALWFFWAVVIVRAMQGLSLIIGGAAIVKDADGIPLETFPSAASQSIVAVFMVSGLSRLVLSLLCVLVLVRYRSAVPLMLTVMALDQIGKEILLRIYPIVRVGDPIGPTVNLILLLMTLLGLGLSMYRKTTRPDKG